MKADILFILFNLSTLNYITTRTRLPALRYSRLDDRWKDYILTGGQRIGNKSNIITKFNSDGVTLTLLSTVLMDYNITCEEVDCTPLTLNTLIQHWIAMDSSMVDKLLEVNYTIEYHYGTVIDWGKVVELMNSDSMVFFITKPVDCGSSMCNTAGNIYEVDFGTQTFKYYDDFGNLGQESFENVSNLSVTVFNLADNDGSLQMRFLE
jgi:hypothetical protein